MDYQVIIISQNYYNIPAQLSNITLDHCKLLDSNSLIYDDNTYYFDYLIIEDLSSIKDIKIEKRK